MYAQLRLVLRIPFVNPYNIRKIPWVNVLSFFHMSPGSARASLWRDSQVADYIYGQ